ncbi:unnamed protein product [Leptosia nina]|uniref:Uncharacterized protein n=1 Tax=Leptosia nina TaxID=320188 RepID=A0AAV1JMV2_9NEOP
MINNENTAKQTAVRRERGARRGSLSNAAARVRRVSVAAATFENRCSIRNQRRTALCKTRHLMTYPIRFSAVTQLSLQMRRSPAFINN